MTLLKCQARVTGQKAFGDKGFGRAVLDDLLGVHFMNIRKQSVPGFHIVLGQGRSFVINLVHT